MAVANLIGTDDPGDGTGRWRTRRLSIFRVQHIEIFETRAGVEEDDRIVAAEEAAGPQFLVSDQGRSAFWRGEDAFYPRPMTSGIDDFVVGGGESYASTFFQNVEDQVVPVGFGNAESRSQSRGVRPHF